MRRKRCLNTTVRSPAGGATEKAAQDSVCVSVCVGRYSTHRDEGLKAAAESRVAGKTAICALVAAWSRARKERRQQEPLLATSLNCTSAHTRPDIPFTRRVAAAAAGVQRRALFKGGAMNNPGRCVAFTRLAAQHVSH